jgi:hypothetical protein
MIAFILANKSTKILGNYSMNNNQNQKFAQITT